jgi:signal transduction histidine kinase
MQATSIPALVSFVLNLIFSLIAWLYLKRDRTNVSFALFTSVIAMVSLSCFFLFESFTTKPSYFWLHVTLTLGPILLFVGHHFVFVFTGYIDRMNESLLLIPLKKYFLVVIGYTVFVSFIVHFQFISQNLMTILDPRGLSFQISLLNPFFLTFLLFAVFIIALLTTMVIKALREVEPGPRKTYLRMIARGLAVIYLTAPALKILPLFNIPLLPYVFLSTSVGSVFFFIAVVRYQLEEIQELNIGLEQKVEERTRNLRSAQTKLIESAKQASLGRLVAGIAHELNNPIGAVHSTNSTIGHGLEKLENLIEKSGLTPQLEDKMTKLTAVIKESLEVNDEGAERVADIVQRMKGFVQLDEAELQKVDIHEGLEDTLTLLPHDLIENIDIVREYGNLPSVVCYSARMNQVFYNILINSAEAVGDNGRILIKTDSDKENVTVQFIDNGRGIKTDHLDKIFEPGFTTRGVGVGTGLGLTIAYQVMKDHQGEIDVKSDPEIGTEVTLNFPIRVKKI